MTDLKPCPSCREPLDHPSGDGCANMTDHRERAMSDRVGEAQLAAAIEAQEYNLVALLGLVPYPDGNAWCVLWGSNLQEGVAGFGDTPYLAVLDFNAAHHRTIKGDTHD